MPLAPSSPVTWAPPKKCDKCPHPISAHTIWEPDELCNGWMLCIAEGCMACWHSWPKLEPAPETPPEAS